MASSSYTRSASAALFLAFNLVVFACSPTAATGVYPLDLLGVCANVVVGSPPPVTYPCCSLFTGLTDLEAAVSLCAAIKAGILGICVDFDAKIKLILECCGRTFPDGYHCA